MNEKIREMTKKERYTIDDLLGIMVILRSPEGCPWDREQTHRSIRRDLIEETYEVAEAIDRGDPTALCEELGDLLLQVVFHSRISEEDGEFTFADAVDGVCRKMILRHPHVFGDVTADTTDEVLKNWDSIKRGEKNLRSSAEELAAVAHTLSSLRRAAKLSSKCKKLGVPTGAPECSASAEELPGELFAAAARAKELGLDPEKLLSDYCDSLIAGVRD
ncbi:MAG: YabN family protein [Candidatus Flemingiibacterium sp.]